MGKSKTSVIEEQLQMVADCEDSEEHLADWEHDFVASIGEQLGDGKSLTEKQDACLTKIWEKVT